MECSTLAVGTIYIHPAASLCLMLCSQDIAILVAMQEASLSPEHSKILSGDVGMQTLSGHCRQLPVEEGEKLVKFKAQRFGLKALW